MAPNTIIFLYNFARLSASHECMINPHKGSSTLLLRSFRHFHKLCQNTMSFDDLRLCTSLPFALCIEWRDNSVNQHTGSLIGASSDGKKKEKSIPSEPHLTYNMTMGRRMHKKLSKRKLSTIKCSTTFYGDTWSSNMHYICAKSGHGSFFQPLSGCWDMESRQIFFPFILNAALEAKTMHMYTNASYSADEH